MLLPNYSKIIIKQTTIYTVFCCASRSLLQSFLFKTICFSFSVYYEAFSSNSYLIKKPPKNYINIHKSHYFNLIKITENQKQI